MSELSLFKKKEGELPFTYEIYIPEQDFLSQKRNIETDELRLLPTSYQMPEQEDVIDVEYDASVLEADKWDYLVAAASGFITATLNTVFVGELSLVEANSWGRKETDKFVMAVAHTQGYKGNDLSAAIQHLEKLFPIPSDKVTAQMGGGLQHHLKDFAHHPTPAGLAFSILSQFTKCGYGTDKDGNFIKVDIPDGEYFGSNICEKIFFGTAIWAFHLISDMAGSSSNAGAGTGIPGCILSFFKEVSALPLFSELTVKYKDDDIGFSVWISKVFNGTLFRSDENPKGIRFDLRTEMGVAYQIGKQAIPVIANECIVRCFYLIRRLYLEIDKKEVRSLQDISKLDPNTFLPFNNRSITHMTTVSSGVFLAITMASATVRATVKNKGNKDEFVRDFLLYVNYAGIARFGFTISAEAKYVVKDLKKIYQEYQNRRNSEREPDVDFKALEYLSLTAEQAKILHSLKFFKVQYDIQNETDEKDKAQKGKWLAAWVESNDSPLDDIQDSEESKVYDAILREVSKGSDLTWLYLIALELSVFHPYYPIQNEDIQEYKKLKCKADYDLEKFCKMQMIISTADYKALTRAYQKSASELSGKNTKAFVGVGATVAIATVTGGVALAFAPEIAVALAGQSFVGLYGAALTSASLAAIGGGSLAVGGLGMAGGTAIITGGGALLGMVGTGAITATSLSLLSSKAYVLNECAKLLTVCRFILIGSQGNKAAVVSIAKGVDAAIDKLEYELNQNKPNDETSKEEKADFKEQQSCLACLQKCSKLLKKMSAE